MTGGCITLVMRRTLYFGVSSAKAPEEEGSIVPGRLGWQIFRFGLALGSVAAQAYQLWRKS